MDDSARAPHAIQDLVHRGVPLAAAWGIEVLRADGGGATCRLPWREDLLRPGGTMSGPVLAEARVLKHGRITFGEVTIRGEDTAEIAAHVTTSWAAVTPRG